MSTFGGHRKQWISHKKNIRLLEQLKKFKSCANLAHLPKNRARWAELAVLFSSRILIFDRSLVKAVQGIALSS